MRMMSADLKRAQHCWEASPAKASICVNSVSNWYASLGSRAIVFVLTHLTHSTHLYQLLHFCVTISGQFASKYHYMRHFASSSMSEVIWNRNNFRVNFNQFESEINEDSHQVSGNVFQNIIAWRVLIINFDLLFPHFISNEFLAPKWVLKQNERSDEFMNKMGANIWSNNLKSILGTICAKKMHPKI